MKAYSVPRVPGFRCPSADEARETCDNPACPYCGEQEVEERPHPAKYTDVVLDVMAHVVSAEGDRIERVPKLLDPFGGVGLIHRLHPLAMTTAVDIEPEWVVAHSWNLLGDSLYPPEAWRGAFDIVATSVTYANRMADHHNAKDPCSKCKGQGAEAAMAGHCFDIDGALWHEPGACKAPECGMPERGDLGGRCCPRCSKCKGTGLSHRRSYFHYLGRRLHPANSGQMQWGDEWRQFHHQAADAVKAVLKRGGLLAWNIKDHQRDHAMVRVSEWCFEMLEAKGFVLEEDWLVPVKGYRYGRNHEAREEFEHVMCFRLPG